NAGALAGANAGALARAKAGALARAKAGPLARVARSRVDWSNQEETYNERAATRIEPIHEIFLQRTVASGGARPLLSPRPVTPTTDPPASATSIAIGRSRGTQRGGAATKGVEGPRMNTDENVAAITVPCRHPPQVATLKRCQGTCYKIMCRVQDSQG